MATINETGLLSALELGDTIVTADYEEFTSAPVTVTVSASTLLAISISPSSATRPKGKTQQFELIGTYTDGDRKITTGITWESTEPSKATINSSGVATAVEEGDTYIIATYSGITTDVVLFTITPKVIESISISPPGTTSLPKGRVQHYTAEATYSDGSTGDVTPTVTWNTSNAGVAEFSITPGEEGRVTVMSESGSSNITATQDSITSNTAVLTAQPKVIDSIDVSPADEVLLPKGRPQQYTATATYSDGTTGNITSTASWTSGTPSVATIAAGGLATVAAETGSTNITATQGGVTSSPARVLTALPKVIDSIAISPAGTTSLPKGRPQQYTAEATYSDGSKGDITSTASWNSETTSVATIAAGGLASVVAEAGSTNITATQDSKTSNTAVLTALPKVIDSVTITPAGTTSLPKGRTQQYTAEATYSDGTTGDITSTASWNSATPSVATIAAGGLASVVAEAGSSNITATQDSKTSNTAVLTALPKVIDTIAVTPETQSLPKGRTRQYTATATYSDGTSDDITDTVTWTSSATGVGEFSSTPGEEGLAKVMAESGSTNITATRDSKTSNTAVLTALEKVIDSIAITPAEEKSLAKGLTQQYAAEATYSDGTTGDITATASWGTSAPGVATVDSSGLATVVGDSSFTNITATKDSVTSNAAKINALPPELLSIDVSPSFATKAAGFTQQFTLYGNYTDKVPREIKSGVSWSSSDTDIATINSGTGLANAIAKGTVTITAQYDGKSDTADFEVTDALLDDIRIEPDTSSLPRGRTQQFKAIGVYSDSSEMDITNDVSWASANGAIVSINDITGLAKAESIGSTTITAGKGTVVSDPVVTVTVTAAVLDSIAITPESASIAKGRTQQYQAIGTMSDGTSAGDITTSVTWASSATGVATIGESTGLALAVYAGGTSSTNITAEKDGVTSNIAILTVTPKVIDSIAVTPETQSLPRGRTQQYTATATYSDGTTGDITSTASWNSATPSVATIAAGGLASVVAEAGSTNITATQDSKTSTTAVLTALPKVIDSIAVTPTTQSLPKGRTQQYQAIATYSDLSTGDITATASWNSETTSVATIAAGGLATVAAEAGSTNITASQDSKTSNTAVLTAQPKVIESIAITPETQSLPKGRTQQYTAEATYSDGSKGDITSTASWNSATPSVATIAAGGLASVVAESGSSNITATQDSKTSNTAVLTALPKVLDSIQVEPESKTITVNRVVQYKATGVYSDMSTADITSTVDWTSSDPSIASIVAGGAASTIATGNVQITATATDGSGKTRSVDLVVTSAVLETITVSPVNSKLAQGMTQQYTATGLYNDGSTQDLTNSVTWGSVNGTGNAIIDAGTGVVTAVSPGTVTITATKDSIDGSTALEVTNATLTAITVSPLSVSIAKGMDQQYKAVGIFSDSTTKDMTDLVTWESTVILVATISNADGSKGLASSVDTGDTTIRAIYGTGPDQKIGTASLNVSDAELLSMIIIPSEAVTIGYGTYQQFSVTGNYSDGRQRDITAMLTWTSSLPSVAEVSNTAPYHGRAVSISAGTTTIKASDPVSLKEITATLEVKLITLDSIIITPQEPSIEERTVKQMKAEGVYNDGTKQDLTTQVTWYSVDQAIASVSNVEGSQGLVTGVSPGTTAVSAKRDGITGSTNVTVTADVIRPTVISAELSGTDTILVTYDEPVDVVAAATPSNYKVALSASLPAVECSVDNNTLFTDTVSSNAVTGVTVLSPTEYQLTFSGTLQQAEYAVVVSRAGGINDLSNNVLGCPNIDTFAGVDTTPPYMLNVTTPTPTSILVTFSEGMKRDGSATAANNSANYTLTQNSGEVCLPEINSAETVEGTSGKTFRITLKSGMCAVSYRLAVNANVTDTATPIPNKMGDPKFLNFTGNEQLKVVSAEALTEYTVKVSFNKAVNPGINTANSAGCTGNTECSYRYKFEPNLDDITGATVDSNVVTITHTKKQTGGQYTVIVANGLNNDGFDNSSWGSIQSTDATPDNVQAAPRDRAPFLGKGKKIDSIADGEYFTDPFGDATSFSFAFVYAGRVYLGPNEDNKYMFRFDANGTNAVLVTNKFSGKFGINEPYVGGSDIGFGWDDPIDGYRGYYGETGAVGFNSVKVDLGGTVYDEILVAGPYNPGGFTNAPVYFTDDRDNELDWRFLTFSGTGGGNTRAMQFVYGTNGTGIPSNNAYVYLGASSGQEKQAPVVSVNRLSKTGDVVTQASTADMSFRSVAYMGKSAGKLSNEPASGIVGIDSAVKFNNYLYMGNNGDVRYSNDFTGFGSNNSTIRGNTDLSGSTLALPTEANGGLGKLRPGQKGIPRLLEFNGKLYMARNVSTAVGDFHKGNDTPLRGELWQCNPGGDGICQAGEWKRIIFGTEDELKTSVTVTAKSVSLLEAYGNVLYVGFDDTEASEGVRIFRIANSDPSPTDGVTIVGQGGGTGWTQLGPVDAKNGIGGNYMNIISSTTISDGIDNYLYLTAKKAPSSGDESIRVFRQKN